MEAKSKSPSASRSSPRVFRMQLRRWAFGVCVDDEKIGLVPNHPFNKVFHYKPSILGYPYFWKHPCVDDEISLSYYTITHRQSHGIGIFTYMIFFMFIVNVAKYTIHGSYGLYHIQKCSLVHVSCLWKLWNDSS